MDFHWREIFTVLMLAAAAQLAAIPASAATFVEEARLTDDQPQRRNYFGLTPAIDGNTAVIGTRLFQPNESTSGGVVVFTRSGATWQYRTRLAPADAPTGDYKAIRVAADLAGDVLVFSVANQANPQSGNVYVYTGAGAGWSLTAELVPGPDDFEFGKDVATDGATLLIDSFAGTHVYVRDGNGWSHQVTLPGVHGGDVIGDTAVLTEDGAVAVYTRSGGSWSRTATLPVGADFRIRELVYDSGTIMVTGEGDGFTSALYAFERTASGWRGPIELHPDGRFFSLALSGDHAVVTSSHAEHNYEMVNLFQQRSGTWMLDRTFPGPERFGAIPALDGNTAILGIPFATDENGSWFIGAAYVYRIRPGIGQGQNVHCTADVDGDGGQDIAVVTAQREVSVRRLDGSAVNDFLLDSFGYLRDTALLPDTSTNGAAELVSLVQTPRSAADPVLPAAGQVRDLLTGTTLAELSFATGIPAPHVGVLADLTGNGMPEVAAVSLDRPVTGVVHDSLTSALVSEIGFADYIEPRDLDVFPDLNGDGRPELAVLGNNRLNGSTDKIELRDPVAGTVTRHIWLGSGWTVIAQARVNDLNGNGVAEVAVLREHPDGRVNVQIRDLETGAWVGSVAFTPAYSPSHLVAIPDVNGNGTDELVVFGPRDDGFNQKAVVRDSRTGQALRNLWFDRNFPGQDFASCGDLNGNGADDVALLGYNPLNGRNKVIVKDTATGDRLAMVHFQ